MPFPMANTSGIKNQVLSLGPASVKSVPLAYSTMFVRLVSDVNCYISYGLDPTASNSSYRLIANRPEFFGVDEDKQLRVAAIL